MVGKKRSRTHFLTVLFTVGIRVATLRGTLSLGGKGRLTRPCSAGMLNYTNSCLQKDLAVHSHTQMPPVWVEPAGQNVHSRFLMSVWGAKISSLEFRHPPGEVPYPHAKPHLVRAVYLQNRLSLIVSAALVSHNLQVCRVHVVLVSWQNNKIKSRSPEEMIKGAKAILCK